MNQNPPSGHTAPTTTYIDLPESAGRLAVTVLTDRLVRLTWSAASDEPVGPSWAVVRSEWPPVATTRTDGDGVTTLETKALRVSVRHEDGRVAVLGRDGTPILDGVWVMADGSGSLLRWSQPSGRRVYGCGEKAGPLERRGEPMEMWNTDAGSYEVGADPLYQSIPFCLGMDGGAAHGLFVDNTYRQVWDLTGDEASVRLDGGPVDLYVFVGPDPAEVVGAFTDLVGRHAMPPLWSVGYQQSRYSYYPEAMVREVARGFRDRRIPCDVLHFDIHYMDGYRDFTWDRSRFPDPAGLLAGLRGEGFHSIAILDPGILVEPGYEPYDSLTKGGFVVKNPDGTPAVGRVWPGQCVFPDFTDARCRDWWAERVARLAADGLDGFWNDMNEPAVFEGVNMTLPEDVLHNGGGIPGSHARYHNVYGMQMARSTREGLRRIRPGLRPFVLSRSGYAGIQRYAAAWTGDNLATWEHFRMSLAMVMNFGLSGQGFSGPDIGGFVGDPSPELFTRWLQAGALFPYCRVHCASETIVNDVPQPAAPQEPWSYGGEWTAINKASIELRYRLLPYLYTLFEAMTRTGLPILRPLFLEYPDDDRFQALDNEFLVGSDLLAAPVLYEGATSREVVLPEGVWYDFWTNEVIEGGRTITVQAPILTLPLFVRAGSILPLQEVVQHTGEMASTPIRWRIYPANGEAEGLVYEDDGESMGYQAGEFFRTRVKVRVVDGEATVTVETEGSYQSQRPEATFEVAGSAG